jgi:hypothetical protein
MAASFLITSGCEQATMPTINDGSMILPNSLGFMGDSSSAADEPVFDDTRRPATVDNETISGRGGSNKDDSRLSS